MRVAPLFILTILAFPTFSQKVGLVLSGGAAKAIAHVGVLRALEESEIPIDYVVGTSMGGIIAGCYAAGMSPDQIEEMILSRDFLRWINGQSEKGYNYYYHLSDDNPHFLKLNLSLDSTLNIQLNSTIATDVSLNFALAEKMAQASAISKDNFDSLFIPLRVLASDIFTQNQIILSKGFLNDALRATQTVPLFYTPIRVDGKYLFDGGIYNNFPVDVAQHEFNPDVIIGSNVSTKIYNTYPFDKDEQLISNSLLFMLLDKSDPAKIPENGVYIQPNLTGYSSYDFGRVKSMIDSGYVQTLRQMDDIKRKITDRVSCETVMVKRNKFNTRNLPMLFEGLSFKGYNSKQRKYIKRLFRIKPGTNPTLSFHTIKKNYFRLVSENYFANAYPNILYNQNSKKFQLQLTRRAQKNFQVDFGGVIATRNISNIFLGLNFFNFGSTLIHTYLGLQTGNFYRSAILRTRIDFPWQFYLEPEIAFNGWNYLEGNDIFQQLAPTILKRIDRRYGLRIGCPMGKNFKSTLGIDGISNFDRYAAKNVFISTDTLDELSIKGIKASWIISFNSLNRKQYASDGKAFALIANYFNVNEFYKPGTTSNLPEANKVNYQWLRVKGTAEQYFNAGWFKPGYFAEAVFSNQPFFQNYYSTIINAPAFLPLQDSRTFLFPNFRAFNYLAGGIRSVFSLQKRLDFRTEAYLFKPFQYLEKGLQQETILTTKPYKVFLIATAGFVLHSPIGPVSLSVNYYDDTKNQLGALLHVGFLLYNKHSIDQ